MKLIILRNNLKEGLDATGRAIGSQLNLPILGSVLIKTHGNRIYLSATNLELAITREVFGKVVEEGSVTIPHTTLASIVSNLASERVHLEKTKAGALELKTDNYKARLQGAEEKDFPIIPEVKDKEECITINSGTLKDMLARVIIAGEISEFRPEISGVHFVSDATALKLVATDSFRLAETTTSGSQLKNTFKKNIEATIPLKTAQELVRVLPDDGSVRIYQDKSQILFESEGLSLISRLIEGDFPSYESIVPKEIDTEVIVKREELISALKLTGSFAPRSSDVTLKTKDKNVLEVYASSNSIGENSYLIPAKVNGAQSTAVFNWRYLLDGVRAGEGKDVFLGLNGQERPALVKSPGDDASFYILMPIRQA